MKKRRKISHILMIIGGVIFISGSIFCPDTQISIIGWIIAVIGIGIYFYDFVKFKE